MATLGFAEAFGKYNAKLKNVQWSVCAINPDNELVVSLWCHHRIKTRKGELTFRDSFDRWPGPGNTEFRVRVAHAFKTSQPVRLIIVSTDEVAYVQSGQDARKVKKRFAVRDDVIGKVTEINGDTYIVCFVKESR